MHENLTKTVGDVVTMDQSCNYVHDPWLIVKRFYLSFAIPK